MDNRKRVTTGLSGAKRVAGILIAGMLGLLAACSEEAIAPHDLDGDAPLIVLTRNDPSSYFINSDNEPDGFEYHLTKRLADDMGVPVEYKLYDSLGELFAALEAGEGHLAAASLTATKTRREKFLPSPPYLTVDEQVVCHRTGKKPEAPEELPDVSIEVPAGSSYVETLQGLKIVLPGLEWTASNNGGTASMLADVWEGKVDCTIADSHIVAVNRRYHPELEVAFSLPAEQKLVWLMRKEDLALGAFVDDWMPRVEKKGILKDLYNRFYAFIPIFDYVDIRTFRRRIDSRLPRYEAEFNRAAALHDIPPLLLAAQAYQESHWDPKAKSATGVRGLMMLTEATAERVGVKNRLDPMQSIRGGAKYLRELMDRLPEDIHEQDRLWFALAAYNIGMGHLYDARRLADRLGKDKNRWSDMREVLPLLAKKEHYSKLRYGFARGHEAARYVRRVRNYWDILEAANRT